MTIFVFFLGALLGFFWLLLLQTLFWNLPKSDSRSHYQKVNKVSDTIGFFSFLQDGFHPRFIGSSLAYAMADFAGLPFMLPKAS